VWWWGLLFVAQQKYQDILDILLILNNGIVRILSSTHKHVSLQRYEMNFRTIIFLIGVFSLFNGCASTTPGDAAYSSKHYKQAGNLYRQGAEMGDKNAALKLGLMLSENKISTPNYGSAVEWFIKACKLGSSAGCHNTGNAYEYAKMGAYKNYNIARKYYTIAAEKGFIQSQYNLGTLYANQYLNDDVKGLKWLFIAKKTADSCSNEPICQWVQKDPPKHQTKLMNRMNETQVINSKIQANDWTIKQ
jgi:hypothetical protein